MKKTGQLPPPFCSGNSDEQIKQRQDYFSQRVGMDHSLQELFSHELDLSHIAKKNCENFVGSVEIPVGTAGPLPLRGDWEQEVFVPLATTEGALVASVNRGCKVLSEAGGVTVFVEKGGMTRSPVFECPTGLEARKFRDWFEDHIDRVRDIAEGTSQHLKLLSHQSWIRGRYVYVRFSFDTDQAMGMNMVTIALQEALADALERNPHIKLTSLSSNVCTDKKDSVMNSILGRGYWVQAEAVIPHEVVHDVLKTSADHIQNVHVRKNLIGSNLAGSFSQNAHVANVLSAMYIATGQDPAHVVEGSKAFLVVEPDTAGVYVALTLPNIQVGVVGGGTGIVQQRQARLLIAETNTVTSEQLAMVVSAAALAGELSLLAALAENQLSYAHQKHGRGKI